ncbi:hypothetical protein [Methylocella tundrae]|uniref:Uncharacterized protein n=1 Tax=Methylocella tundrae TaxID=227605 RepID=A0A4V6IMF9_METTU|nr:hypothetical protein [Methylocella tundrae]WPP05463.1 hypothetical protein SIN04_06475 [Methylocella tundrae]VFU07883.1 conserved protein of unknown function [Methylocella tundrae]
MTARSDIIDLALVIHHETKPGMKNEGAILVSDDGDREKAVWLPKAAVEFEITSPDVATVTMPERLAIDKGLV